MFVASIECLFKENVYFWFFEDLVFNLFDVWNSLMDVNIQIVDK